MKKHISKTDSDTLTAFVVERLNASESFVIPVKKLYLEYKNTDLTFEDFLAAIMDDPQFQITAGPDLFEGIEATEEEKADEEQAMEAMGYYTGPRVMLKDRPPTAEMIFREMAKQLNIINESLLQAYTHRPTNDHDAEEKLLTAMDKAHDLEQKLAQTFTSIKEKN